MFRHRGTALAAILVPIASVGLSGSVNYLASQDLGPGILFILAASVALVAIGAYFVVRETSLTAWRPRPAEEEAAIRRIHAQLLLMTRSARMGPDYDLRVELEYDRMSGDSASPDIAKIAADREISVQMSSMSPKGFIADISGGAKFTVLLGDRGSGKSAILVRLAELLAQSRIHNDHGRIPLYVTCTSWQNVSASESTLHKWLTTTASSAYGIEANLVNYWSRKQSLALLVDGLDEIPLACRDSFVHGLNQWTGSRHSPVILSATREAYSSLQVAPAADRVASLLPLRDEQLAGLIRRAAKSIFGDSPEIQQALLDLLASIEVDSRHTPLTLSLISEGLAIGKSRDAEGAWKAPDGPRQSTLFSGDEYLKRRNLPAAREAYELAFEQEHDAGRGPAALRLGLVFQLEGRHEEAQRAFQTSVAVKLEETVVVPPVGDTLTEDEDDLVSVMRVGVDYDDIQISAKTSRPLGQVRSLLSGLHNRGLVEVSTDEYGVRGYRLFEKSRVSV